MEPSTTPADSRPRLLAGALEAFAAQVYFSPECHEAYAQLGFAPSPGPANGVSMPDGPAYFCSRGSLLGQVPGTVVAAAFAVFNPEVVVPAVTFGWGLTDAATIEEARTKGGIGQLVRILGEAPEGTDVLVRVLGPVSAGLPPEGRPLYAGLLAAPVPDLPLGAAWRYADRLREFRGDCHISAWTAAGLDAVEIGLLTELYWGLPMNTYIRTRAWTRGQLEAGVDRLEAKGLVAGDRLTEEGRALRESIEEATDRQCAGLVDAIGDEFDRVVGILEAFSAAIRTAGGYPASGPHDLARAARGA